MQRLEQIENINNSIEGNNNIDLNEKIVNQYYLKWTLGGINALTASEQNNLEALAMSCPFINGTSVYKARTIYASINAGIDFDDLQICHGAGVYKNGNGTSNEVAIDPKLLDVLANESFALYPNPASTQITIDYALAENEEGKIIFYDLLGRECLTINLSSRINRVTTSINMLHNGVYLFRYYKNGVPYSNGKLIKE